MRILTPVLSLLFTIATPAFAQDYLCKNGAAERTISVQHEVEGQELPCVVKYDKRDQDMIEFPYNARNQAGFCAERAQYLADRLGRFGWACERTETP